jgi:hypothetical protein
MVISLVASLLVVVSLIASRVARASLVASSSPGNNVQVLHSHGAPMPTRTIGRPLLRDPRGIADHYYCLLASIIGTYFVPFALQSIANICLDRHIFCAELVELCTVCAFAALGTTVG